MKLIYFAQIREMIGHSEENILTPEDLETVADLIEWLKHRGGAYQHALGRKDLRMAVNQEFAEQDTLLAQAYEVAFFPPMTGG